MDLLQLFLRYGLDYHYLHLNDAIDACGPITDKRVFEIGGCLPREIVIGHFHAASWIGIDLPDYWRESGDLNPSSNVKVTRKPLNEAKWPEAEDHYCLQGDVVNLPPSFDGQFDLVFSTSAFEHISDIAAAMSAAARILKPGGRFFAIAFCLWLSSKGHHLPPLYHQGKPFPLEDGILLPWMHLYMTPEEMQERLLRQLPVEVVDQIIHHVYLSSHINRALPEEYEFAFMKADFKGRTVRRIYETPPSCEIQEMLERNYGERRFDQFGVCLIGEK